jgi:hypothetical protein
MFLHYLIFEIEFFLTNEFWQVKMAVRKHRPVREEVSGQKEKCEQER